MTDLAQRLREAIDDPTDFDEKPTPLRLQTRQASTIQPKDVEWIWKPWLPAGMLTLFAGYGGSGKSTVALDIAAACSTRGILPDGQPAPPLNTLIFAAEDSPEHTIIPRLIAMGADLDCIHVVDGIARNTDDPGWVQLRNHAPLIEQAVNEHDIGLVIIDPVSSFIGDANSDKESDVRSGITPLIQVAERTGAAILMIRHVSKGETSRAASRILGSTAWHDIPRVVWMLADAPDDHQPESREDGTRDTRRVLGAVKANLTAKPAARWCIQPVNGPLRWLSDPSPVTIDECFQPQSDRGGKSRDAEEWLRERLAGGSQPTTSVDSAAKDAGISKATLKRARASLNVDSRKESTGGWVLSLPPRLIGSKYEGVHPEPDAGHVKEVSALHNVVDPKALYTHPLNALHNIVEPTGTKGADVSDFRADGKDGAIDYKTQFLPSLPWDHPLSELRRLLAGEGEGFHDLYRLVRRDEKAVLRHPLDIAAEDQADADGLIDELRDPDQPYSVGTFASDVRRAWETLTMEDRVLSAHVWTQTAKMDVPAEAAKHEGLRRAA